MDSDSSDLESEKNGAKGSQKVLIEKGGKFELVNASDMEAVSPGTAEEDITQTGLKVEGVKEAKEMTAVENQGNEGGTEKTSDRKGSSPVADNPAVSKSEHNLKASSQVRIVEEKASSPHKTAGDKAFTGSSTSTRQLANRPQRRQLAIERTKSAPGGRVSSLLEQDEVDKQRRQRNEIAFGAWLNKKKEEYMKQQRLVREQTKVSEEDLEAKRLRNEATFNSWIAAKDRELQVRRAQEKIHRPATSIPKADNAAAYSSWVERKNHQKRQETQLVTKKHKQVEETASKSDNSVIDKAYKNWLHKKNMQAREDAARKAHYKRIYFRESKKLKQSLTSRFDGF